MNSIDSDGDMSLDKRLAYCMRQGQNEKALQILKKLDSCDLTKSISGRTLLHVAADSANDVTVAQHLIDRGCKVDALDDNGNTPLMLACLQDYTDVITLLVEAKASVLIINHKGKSAADIVFGGADFKIHILDPFLKRVKEECSNDSLRTAKELLRVGCSLTRAVRLKDVAITKYMLDNGCNVNDKDRGLCGWPPLHQALVIEDHENAKLLIDRRADLNFEDARGWTSLGYAYDFEILVILLNRGAKVVDDDGTLVAYNLFRSRGREVVEMLIERYNLKDFSIKDRRGTSLFQHIADNKNFDPVEILQKHYDYRIDIDQKDHKGLTALFKAVTESNARMVEFLLKKGAKLNASENRDSEVLHAVARIIFKENRKDREKILMLLLQYGADIQGTSENDRGDDYFTLDYVISRKNFGMVKIILARLALVEDLGGEIKESYRNEIEHTAMCKKYFGCCKRTIAKLKREVLATNRRVTLYDFLTCSEETLVELARREEFVATVQSMVWRKRHSNSYYYKVLRLRVKKAGEIVNLRKNLLRDVNVLIPELHSNQIIIQNIVEYIVCDTLRLMARQPTFKCIIDNE